MRFSLFRSATYAGFAVSVTLLSVASAHAQIRIVSYNIASSSGNGTPRTGLDTILQAIGTEQRGGVSTPIGVLLLQESLSAQTTAATVASQLNTIYGAGRYATGTLNGGTTGSGTQSIVFNTQVVQLLNETTVGATSANGLARQELRYRLRPVGAGSDGDFFVYNGHWKSADDSASQARRNVEAQAIRADVDGLGQGVQAIFTGDFNLYTSGETAYQTMLSAGAGQAFDPINRPGSWHSNAAFQDIFTQAPSANPPSGLTGGGLDDRFDFQLFTNELTDGAGLEYVSGTYGTFGVNGSVAVNGSINDASNTALAGLSNRQQVLNLLTTVSDHLPVVADYRYVSVTAAPEPGAMGLVLLGAGVWAVAQRRKKF